MGSSLNQGPGLPYYIGGPTEIVAILYKYWPVYTGSSLN